MKRFVCVVMVCLATVALADERKDIILEKVELRDVEAREAVAHIQELSKNHTADGKPVNVVWMLPANQKLPRVTMNLRQISLLDAIRYLVNAIGLSLRVEPHALVIYKPAPPPDPNAKPQ